MNPPTAHSSIPRSGLPIDTMNDVWRNAVEKFPRKPAAIYRDTPHTYAELDAKIGALASRLAENFGVTHGCRVAILSPNTLEFYLLYWATLRCGGVLVPINYRQSLDQLRFILEETAPNVLVVDVASRKMAAAVVEGLDAPPSIIAVGYEPDEGQARFDALIEPDGAPAVAFPRVAPDDLAVVVYTSGTTGMPKGPMISHANLLFNIRNTIIPHSFRHEDVHLLVVPLFHCTALNTIITTSAFLASTVVIAPRPEPAELLESIARHRVTTFLGVPTLLHLMTLNKRLAEFDLSSLRLIAYSGSPMRPALIRRLRELFPGVWLHNFFGLTETISITHVLASCDALDHADSIGKVLPEVGQKIVGDSGAEAPPNTVGELCFRRENIVRGYWNRPGLLDESIDADGWFRTGDLALADLGGYVVLKGRSKDMIIVGGENVYATEVENVICRHPDVMEAAVVGIEATGVRAYLGELVKAVVVPREGAEVAERDIKALCAKALPSYAVPVEVVFTGALPRTPSGKVIKRELP